MAEGGDFPIVNLKNIGPHVTCILCSEPLTDGTRLCESGHTFCNKCLPKMGHCIECRAKIHVGTRNCPIEQIASMVKYKCHNYYRGCQTLLSKETVVSHHITCPYSKVTCPLEQIDSVRCQWTGRLHQVLDHVKEQHSNKITNRNYFSCTSLQDTHWLTVYKGEVFLYFKQKRETHWYATVMSMGITEALFRGVFVLKSFEEGSNEAVEISITVDLIDDFDKMFDSGRCFTLDDATVRNFIKNDEMNMMVSIEEISTN
jgi:hypothetical protein